MSATYKLHVTLTNDKARLNDRIKHKLVIVQTDHHLSEFITNASVFSFFTSKHILKSIFASRLNGSFGFTHAPEYFGLNRQLTFKVKVK